MYAKDYRAKLSSLFELDGRIGTNEIKAIFPESKRPFDFPKPIELVEELLSFTTSGDDIVLDSFAGSGTTGQAVLSLNRADEQHRRFVLTEMKPSIAREITAERLRRVSHGYKKSNGADVDGLGGLVSATPHWENRCSTNTATSIPRCALRNWRALCGS